MKTVWIVLLALVSPAFAKVAASGTEFLTECAVVDKETDLTDREMWSQDSCLGYVEGVALGAKAETLRINAANKSSVPMPFSLPTGVSVKQLVRVTLKYIRDNPEQAHLNSSFLILDALGKAFPLAK